MLVFVCLFLFGGGGWLTYQFDLMVFAEYKINVSAMCVVPHLMAKKGN